MAERTRYDRMKHSIRKFEFLTSVTFMLPAKPFEQIDHLNSRELTFNCSLILVVPIATRSLFVENEIFN